MPGHLLVVWHPRSPNVARLRDAVLAGHLDADTSVPVRSRSVLDAGTDDLDEAVAVVIVTPEHFGGVAGLTKDLLERIYPWFEEVPDRRPGLPYLLVAKGGTDGTGAVRDVTRILTGLRWRAVLPAVVVRGAVTDDDLRRTREAAATLTVGVDTGVF